MHRSREKAFQSLARAILDERMAETFEQPHVSCTAFSPFGVNLGS